MRTTQMPAIGLQTTTVAHWPTRDWMLLIQRAISTAKATAA
jgi:hypothetical protein